ncbi:MAG: redoxin domain-containing protein [Bacteroidia bacterium]|nr:redoxin domain-containing protein [Bacteroidia bacterium]
MARQFMSIILTTLVAILVGIPTARAQEAQKVEAFQISDSNGIKFDLNEHKEKKAIVVFFTSSNCVFATKYAERIDALYNNFKDKDISFVAINSNDANLSQRDADSLMRQYAPFAFPYLKDRTQQIAKSFGAKVNPEVFVLKPEAGTFMIAYKGAIDDNVIQRAVTKRYAQDAIQSLLNGKLPEIQNAEGKTCEIRWTE